MILGAKCVEDREHLADMRLLAGWELTEVQIKTTQDIATLIRSLQELWLFGGLDTLQNPADEETQRKKAEDVGNTIQVLAQQQPAAKVEEQWNGAEAT